jgi:hypothetical protein
MLPSLRAALSSLSIGTHASWSRDWPKAKSGRYAVSPDELFQVQRLLSLEAITATNFSAMTGATFVG